MALADDKKNIFTTISSYTSFMEQGKVQDVTNNFSSINNKKENIPFLFDTLSVVSGTDGTKRAIGGMFTDVISDSESKIKISLKKQFTSSNSDEQLPTQFKTNGIDIGLKTIDSKNIYKTNPNSDAGDLLYDKHLNSFDMGVHNAIANPGTDVNLIGHDMVLRYDKNTDTLNVKPPSGIIKNIGDYFNDIIDYIKLYDTKRLTTNIMNDIFGTINELVKKTQEQVRDEVELEKKLDQILSNENDFNIPPSDFDEIHKKSTELTTGIVTYNLSCGLIETSLPFKSLDDLIKKISGSTNQFQVANDIENVIRDSAVNNNNIDDNIETIIDDFFRKLIKTFTNELLQAATTQPQMRVLFAIFNYFQNGGVILDEKTKDDIENYRIIINCLAKEIIKIISEYLFKLVVSYLVKLITPIAKKILKEKINQYVKQLASLTGSNSIQNSINSIL